MAASLTIEEESGTYTASIRHSHNGYYAGDFSHAESGLRACCVGGSDELRAEVAMYAAGGLAASAAFPHQLKPSQIVP